MFSYSSYRLALYKTLFSSLLASSRSTVTSHSVLTLAIRIFRFGRSSDRDLDVTHFCQESLTACQMWAHPSPPSLPPCVAESTPSLSLQSASSSCYSHPPTAPLPSALTMFTSSDSFGISAPIAKAASLPIPAAMNTPSQMIPPSSLPPPPYAATLAGPPTLLPSSATNMTDSLEITSHISELSVRSPSLPPKVLNSFLWYLLPFADFLTSRKKSQNSLSTVFHQLRKGHHLLHSTPLPRPHSPHHLLPAIVLELPPMKTLCRKKAETRKRKRKSRRRKKKKMMMTVMTLRKGI
jgi:hypothetical protein